MFKKTLISAVAAGVLLVSAGIANATSLDFTTGNGTAGTNSYSFTVDGITAVTTPLTTASSSTIHQYSGGLGVSSSTPFDNHEIDGAFGDEAVRVTFDQQVNLESILFGAVGTNDDFAYRVDGGSWSTFDIVGGNIWDTGNGYYNFTLPGILGTIFDIAAFGSNDDFKLRGMNVSAVPLPPAVLMFGAALIGLGWMRRRKVKVAA